MTDNFLKALEFVLRREGGFVDNPLDRGGPTNKGITLKTFTRWRVEVCYREKPTVEDLKNIDSQEIKEIYFYFYWKAYNLDVFEFPLSLVLFDQIVNRGRGAIMSLQRALIDMGLTLTSVDGIMGPNTIRYYKTIVDGEKFLKVFINQCQLSYVRIVKTDPSQLVFLEGWIKRTHHYAEFL